MDRPTTEVGGARIWRHFGGGCPGLVTVNLTGRGGIPGVTSPPGRDFALSGQKKTAASLLTWGSEEKCSCSYNYSGSPDGS